METEQMRVSLSKTIIEKIDELRKEKGVQRSAIISIAVDAYYKLEKGGGNQNK